MAQAQRPHRGKTVWTLGFAWGLFQPKPAQIGEMPRNTKTPEALQHSTLRAFTEIGETKLS
nr:MAG TPA: hypothetical protein [Caudoviricetes sp.]